MGNFGSCLAPQETDAGKQALFRIFAPSMPEGILHIFILLPHGLPLSAQKRCHEV